MFLVALVTIVFLYIRLRAPGWRIKASIPKLVTATAAFCGLAAIPFLSFALGLSPSWTGMSLTEEQLAPIAMLHGPIVGTWLVVGFVQLASWKKKALHARVGAFGLYVLIPAVLLELFANAAFVFVPHKQVLLAEALGLPAQMWWKMLPAHFSALSVPVMLLLHWVFSVRAIRGPKRNIRLHIHHMMGFLTFVLAPGIVRYLIQAVFLGSSCQPFGDPADVMLVQTSAFVLTGFVYFLVATLYFVTLPDSLRSDVSVRLMYWLYLVLWVVPGAFQAYWGLDVLPQC